jgi:hypothetical protein
MGNMRNADKIFVRKPGGKPQLGRLIEADVHRGAKLKLRLNKVQLERVNWAQQEHAQYWMLGYHKEG